jgi:hypothetical protein
MSTDAQIAANRNNAQASRGPVTAAGKSRISRNALTHGLYSGCDFVRPDERDLYSEFCAGFQTDLAPEGAIEQTLSAEIVHAAWRLRRCSIVEAGMMPVGADENSADQLDPLLDKTQQSVDRARAHAHRLFHRAMSELRRLQTERQFRIEFLPADFDTTILGLASYKDIAPALTNDVRRKLLLEKLRHTEDRSSASELIAQLELPIPAAAADPEREITIQSQSGVAPYVAPCVAPLVSIGRNSPCNCGSGVKFKRCCGKSAPAVLNLAA